MAGVQSCELAMPPPPPSDATLQVVITRVFVNKLPKKSLFGKCNPFVKLLWNGDVVVHTPIQKGVLEHEWKVDMEKPITEIIHADNYEQGMKENELTIELYHSHALRQPELLSAVVIDGFSLASGPTTQQRTLSDVVGHDGSNTYIDVDTLVSCTRRTTISVREISAALHMAPLAESPAQVCDMKHVGYALSMTFVHGPRRDIKPLTSVCYDLSSPGWLHLPPTSLSVTMSELLECRIEFNVLAVMQHRAPGSSSFRSVACGKLPLSHAASAHERRRIYWDIPLESTDERALEGAHVQVGVLRGSMQYYNLPIPCQLIGGVMTETYIRDAAPLLEGQPLPTIVSELSLLSSKVRAADQATPLRLATTANVPREHLESLKRNIAAISVNDATYWDEVGAVERLSASMRELEVSIRGNRAMRNLFLSCGGLGQLQVMMIPMLRAQPSSWIALLHEALLEAPHSVELFVSSGLCADFCEAVLPGIADPGGQHAVRLSEEDVARVFLTFAAIASCDSESQELLCNKGIVFTATRTAGQSDNTLIVEAALRALEALAHGKGGTAVNKLEGGFTELAPTLVEMRSSETLGMCVSLMTAAQRRESTTAELEGLRGAARRCFMHIALADSEMISSGCGALLGRLEHGDAAKEDRNCGLMLISELLANANPDAMQAAANVGMLLSESTWISSHLLQELEEGDVAQAAVPFVQTLLRSSAITCYEGWKLLEPVMDAIANGTVLFQRADGNEGPGALIVTAMLEAAPNCLPLIARYIRWLVLRLDGGSASAAVERGLPFVVQALSHLDEENDKNARLLNSVLLELSGIGSLNQSEHSTTSSDAEADWGAPSPAVCAAVVQIGEAAFVYRPPPPIPQERPADSPSSTKSRPSSTRLKAPVKNAAMYATVTGALTMPSGPSDGSSNVSRSFSEAKPLSDSEGFTILASPSRAGKSSISPTVSPQGHATFGSSAPLSASATMPSRPAHKLPPWMRGQSEASTSAEADVFSDLSSDPPPTAVSVSPSARDSSSETHEKKRTVEAPARPVREGGVRSSLDDGSIRSFTALLTRLSLSRVPSVSSGATRLLQRLSTGGVHSCTSSVLSALTNVWSRADSEIVQVQVLEWLERLIENDSQLFDAALMISILEGGAGPQCEPLRLGPAVASRLQSWLSMSQGFIGDQYADVIVLFAVHRMLEKDAHESQVEFAASLFIGNATEAVEVPARALDQVVSKALAQFRDSDTVESVRRRCHRLLHFTLTHYAQCRETFVISLCGAYDEAEENDNVELARHCVSTLKQLMGDSNEMFDEAVGRCVSYVIQHVVNTIGRAAFQSVVADAVEIGITRRACWPSIFESLRELVESENEEAVSFAAETMYSCVLDAEHSSQAAADVVRVVKPANFAHTIARHCQSKESSARTLVRHLVEVLILSFKGGSDGLTLPHPRYQWTPYLAMISGMDLDVQYAALMLVQRSILRDANAASTVAHSEVASQIVHVFETMLCEPSEPSSSSASSTTEVNGAIDPSMFTAVLHPDAGRNVMKGLASRNRQVVLTVIGKLGTTDKALLDSLSLDPLLRLLRSKKTLASVSVVKGEHVAEMALGSGDADVVKSDEIVSSVCTSLKAFLSDAVRREQLGPSGCFLSIGNLLLDAVVPTLEYATEHKGTLSELQRDALRVLLRLSGECLQLLTLAAHYAELRTFLVGDGLIPVVISVIDKTAHAALVYHSMFFVLSICEDPIARDELLDMEEVDSIGRWMQDGVDEQLLAAAKSAFGKLGGFVNVDPCSITITGNTHAQQQYFRCHTCGLSDGLGCCLACSKICHRGHELEGPVYGNFYCDCGSTAHCYTRRPPSLRDKGPIKLCSYIFTQNTMRTQSWFSCRTCFRDGNEAICRTCVEQCHVGHQVIFRGPARFFCDCHRRYNGMHLCKCLKHEPPKAGEGARYRGELFLQMQKEREHVKPGDAGLRQVFATEQEDDSGGNEDDTCIVCMDAKKEALFYQCGHIATCIECGSMMKQRNQPCPICRQPIQEVIKAFRV